VDTDIDSLDHGSAREYVLAFLTVLKQTERERAIAEEELLHWERRVKLAESRGEPQLQKLASGRAAELREQAARLAAEEQGLRRKVAVLRQKLAVLRERASFAVDADALLAQLRLLAGEPGSLDLELKDLEAQAALEALKRKQG
jgi:phage shock protein A